MLIKNKMNNTVPFDQIYFGEICIFRGNYYMAIPTMKDEDGDSYNAIDLEAGLGKHIFHTEKVTPLNNVALLIEELEGGE